MKPVELFSHNVHTFWATSYQFDLKLFDQFLLQRLGNQPLNTVVMVDENNVTQTLTGLTEIDIHMTASTNRRYLLHDARTTNSKRFHPKTCHAAVACALAEHCSIHAKEALRPTHRPHPATEVPQPREKKNGRPQRNDTTRLLRSLGNTYARAR